MSASLVEFRELSHWYGDGALRRQILFDLEGTLAPGCLTVLCGPSGSGKTTLLTLLGGLRSAQAGSLRVLGQELHGASERVLVRVRREIGYVFQAHNLLDALSARRNVELGLLQHRGWPERARLQRCDEVLERVGLGRLGSSHPRQLSGGERQRVAIARALVARPRLLLADEPTASLDGDSGREVVALLRAHAAERGMAVLIVTHDPRVTAAADRVLALQDGRLCARAVPGAGAEGALPHAAPPGERARPRAAP